MSEDDVKRVLWKIIAIMFISSVLVPNIIFTLTIVLASFSSSDPMI